MAANSEGIPSDSAVETPAPETPEVQPEPASFEIPVTDIDEDGDDVVAELSDAAPDGVQPPPEAPSPGAEAEDDGAPAQPDAPKPAPQEETPEAQPAPQPEAPQQPEPQGQESTSAPAPDLLKQLEENQEALITGLADQTFALTPEETQALEDGEGAGLIPRMMAKVYYMASVNTLRQLRQFSEALPTMIQQFQETSASRSAIEEKFFGQFPKLGEDKAKFGPQVAAYAEAIKKVNPGISQEDLFSQVGSAVMAANGLEAPKPAKAKPNGFKPAPSGVPQPPTSQVLEPFAGLEMDFDEMNN